MPAKYPYIPQREWDKRNPEKVNQWKANWRKRNPEKAKETDRLSSRKWRQNHPERFHTPRYKIDQGLRSAIKDVLRGKKAGRSWEKLVGYDLQDLLNHLEKQFDEKMNWENYGSYWHIDHRTPKSWFKYETAESEEFRKCWSLENLQPLEANENRSKSNHFSS